jgi:chemotaxis protein MotB
MSYGDLFAGLLLIFALMLLTALYYYQSGVEGIREILLLRQEIVEELKETFESEEGPRVVIDADGVIRFGDRLLFEQNSHVILPEGLEQIQAFAQQYVSVVLANEKFRDGIQRIIVEGHTNDDGEYFYNLRLSQERAYAVMEAIIRSADAQYESILKEKMTAVGRSFSDLLYLDEDRTVVDWEGSRRIELRFDLDDQRIMDQILDRVFGG